MTVTQESGPVATKTGKGDADIPRAGGLLCNLTPWKVAVLGPLVDFAGLGTIMPLLPFFCMEVGASEMWIGFILSAQYFGVVVGSIFWGRMADFIGVRRVYLILLVLDVIFFMCSGLMMSAVGLLVVRFGAGFCALMPVGTAWISMSAPPEKMMVAFTLLIVSALGGLVLGSALGGILSQIPSGIGVGDGGWFTANAFSAFLVLAVLFVALFGTSDPPKKQGADAEKPEGVRQATLNIRFLAVCLTSFLAGNEGGVSMVYCTTLLTQPQPEGYEYTQWFMGIIFMIIGTVLLLSSLFFSGWLGAHTEPLQRICVLGLFTCSICWAYVGLGATYEAQGAWRYGDIVFLVLNVSLFIFQCVIAPTAMAIAAMIAATKAKNANGTIMGIQQMVMNMGQAVGPMIGALLYSWNYYVPWMYLAICESAVLLLNLYIFFDARRSGEFVRGFFDFSKCALASQQEADAPEQAKEEGTAVAKEDAGEAEKAESAPEAVASM